jgi:hypothetical protein
MTTTNALTTLRKNGQPALTEAELLMMEEAAAEAVPSYRLVPPRIKMAGGGLPVWVNSDSGETMKEFDGIAVLSQITRGLWTTDSLGNPPLCSSPNGIHGYFSADPDEAQLDAAMRLTAIHTAIRETDPDAMVGPWECSACPMNRFGTGKDGRGKACNEMRRIIILVDGWSTPAILTLPTMSVKKWDAYASGLRNVKRAYFGVRTRFALEKARSGGGQEYSKADLSKVGDLSAEEIRAVIELRREFEEYLQSLPGAMAGEYEGADVEGTVEDVAPF